MDLTERALEAANAASALQQEAEAAERQTAERQAAELEAAVQQYARAAFDRWFMSVGVDPATVEAPIWVTEAHWQQGDRISDSWNHNYMPSYQVPGRARLDTVIDRRRFALSTIIDDLTVEPVVYVDVDGHSAGLGTLEEIGAALQDIEAAKARAALEARAQQRESDDIRERHLARIKAEEELAIQRVRSWIRSITGHYPGDMDIAVLEVKLGIDIVDFRGWKPRTIGRESHYTHLQFTVGGKPCWATFTNPESGATSIFVTMGGGEAVSAEEFRTAWGRY